MRCDLGSHSTSHAPPIQPVKLTIQELERGKHERRLKRRICLLDVWNVDFPINTIGNRH